MKCDLHVHTWHSGMFTMPVLCHFVRESYSQPETVYRHLKSKGMDLVTITDHDSIEAVEPLRRYDDFFLSEEVTAILPSGNEAHIGVYDITEKQHIQVQRRRNDFFALLAYLSERRIFASVNHVFSGLTGARAAADFHWFAHSLSAFETRNGQLPASLNDKAAALAESLGKSPIGGSDAHAVQSAGCTWTQVRAAQSKEEFLEGLRAGAGVVGGQHGGFCKLTRDIYTIAAGYMGEVPLARFAAPLAAAIPLFTLWNYIQELRFANKWAPALLPEIQPRAVPVWSPAASKGALA